MKEAEGCALLRAKFTEAGYAIVPDFHFREDGIEVDLDGWDAAARVGFEYITREAGDDRQFDHATLAKLEARMERGELYVLLIDEHDAVTAPALEAAAEGFLEEVARRRPQTKPTKPKPKPKPKKMKAASKPKPDEKKPAAKPKKKAAAKPKKAASKPKKKTTKKTKKKKR